MRQMNVIAGFLAALWLATVTGHTWGPSLLEDIQHLADPFVHEGHRAHLDADHLAGLRRFSRTERTNSGCRHGGQRGAVLHKVPA